MEKKGGETGNIKGKRIQTGRGKNRMVEGETKSWQRKKQVQEETIRRKRHREKTKGSEETNQGM